jgi:phosphate transport system substrate-binding protein
MQSWLNCVSWICLTALISTHASAEVKTVKVDGSSTVFPITEAVAEEFQNAQAGKTRVTVGISGTGGGFKKFCRGETDLQDASRPISKEEMETCRKSNIKYLELPVAFDAIVVAVHPQNTWANDITVAELKQIWEPAAQGKITKWNQIRKDWPATDIKLFGAGSDSGTFDYFTEAIVGKAESSRSDYTGSEDDNTLVQGISGNKNAIGYLPFAYFKSNSNKLKALAVTADNAKAISPTKETIESGTYHPLSRPLFIYVADKAMQKPEVQAFTEFFLSNAKTLSAEVNYIALPDQAYTSAKEIVKKARFGTVFNGETKSGVKINDVFKASPML